MTSPHEWKLRVYIEDTDAGGIVYYANYLKFMERARTEMLRDLGAPHAAMMAETQTQFVVQYCNLRFLKPARLEDELVVRTELKELSAASLILNQNVYRGDVCLVSGEVGLACVNAKGSPCRMD